VSHSPLYDEIYKIFNVGDFPLEGENLEVYQNIQKTGIQLITTHPMLFPYNEK